MREPFGADRRYRLQLTGLAGLSVSIVLIAFLPTRLHAQSMSMGAKNPTTPTNPTKFPVGPNLVHNPGGWSFNPSPYRTGISTTSEKNPLAEATENECTWPWWCMWSFDLSTLYEFSNQRSRVSGFSLDSNSAGIDLAATSVSCPYTSFNFEYIYSHGTGSTPGRANETVNQHLGLVSILQPLNPLWCSSWKPADLSACRLNQQLAIIAETAYGAALSSLTLPTSPVQHDTEHPFIQDCLLDYQLAWFPHRLNSCDCYTASEDHDSVTRRYPNLLFELTSGVQFSTVRLDSSSSGFSATSSGRQLDYLNGVSLTCSLPCQLGLPPRLGLVMAAEWDAPLSSDPVRGSKPDHANTAIFTTGLVYNLYPSTDDDAPKKNVLQRHLSFSLLYSYTAFDPLTETNTLQVQVSYSF